MFSFLSVGDGPGGFTTTVEAVAAGLNSAPLCVFGVKEKDGDGVNVASGTLKAAGCVVHANNNIKAGSGGQVDAVVVQAAGTVAGRGGADSVIGSGAAQRLRPGTQNGLVLSPLLCPRMSPARP